MNESDRQRDETVGQSGTVPDSEVGQRAAVEVAGVTLGLPHLFGIVTIAAVLVRLAFVTDVPMSWDSVQYILGVLHFDIPNHEPHPPGYFLYIMLARALAGTGLQPHTALVAISVAAGALTAGIVAVWSARVMGMQAGWLAALIVILSPSAMYFSTRGDTYAMSGLFSALVGYLCWRVMTNDDEPLWPSAVALAIAGGIRPTDAAFLFPLWLWCAWKKGGGKVAANIAIMGLITAAWLLPMLAMTGGLARYRQASGELSRWVFTMIPLKNPGYLGEYALMFLGAVAYLMGGTWPAVLLTRAADFVESRHGRVTIFFALWTLPALVFFITIHLGQSGYLMLQLPAAALLVTSGVTGIQRRLGKNRLPLFIGAVVVINGMLIFTRVHRPAQGAEMIMDQARRVLATFDSQDTAVIAPLPAFSDPDSKREAPVWSAFGFRRVMYAAPHLRAYVFPLEAPEHVGGGPNFGHRMKSSHLPAPVTLEGVANLLVLDSSLLEYLPEGAQHETLMQRGRAEIYRVTVSPQSPVILGPGTALDFQPSTEPR
ncbi:MAG: hypothetical protein R6V19_00580 [Armatimonadota bacterium]